MRLALSFFSTLDERHSWKSFSVIIASYLLLLAFCRHADAEDGEPNLSSTLAPGKPLMIEQGERAVRWRICSATLDAAKAFPAEWRIVEVRAGHPEREVVHQIEATPAGGGRVWWIVERTIEPRESLRFELRPGKAAAPPSLPLVVDRDERRLVVRRGELQLLQYNTAHVVPPEPLDPRFGRSAYLHPVRAPSGRVVTDEFPPDHAHQSGVFLAYTKTRFEGREPNFWELASGNGRVRFARVESIEAGPVFAQFVVHQEHVDETAPGGKVALQEVWKVRVWNLDPSRNPLTMWDIESTLTAATSSPLVLPQYHYGGMALRGARGWGGANATFVTSEGKDRLAGNHTRPHWCDLHGLVDGERAGLALFTHPQNFRYPEPLRIHPTMPYMVYAPSFLGDWEITPGKPHVSRYRFAAHDGDLTKEVADGCRPEQAQRRSGDSQDVAP